MDKNHPLPLSAFCCQNERCEDYVVALPPGRVRSTTWRLLRRGLLRTLESGVVILDDGQLRALTNA